MSPLQQSSIRNRLLKALSPEDFALIQPHLEKVPLELRQMIYEANEPIRHIYFVEQGIISMLAQTDHGRIEIGMIGPEGMVGIAVLLGTDRSPYANMVQAPGEALRLPVERLVSAVRHSFSLHAVLLHYVQFLLTLTAQTAYANADFGVEARLARWILMTHDRLDRDDLPLTHEFLSMMLGTRRSSVTTATHILEGNGLIRATRGAITVCDREKLIELAGDAYGLAEAEYDRLFGER